MDKEKRIEEMAKTMCGGYGPYCGCGCSTINCRIEDFSTNLYNAGYGNLAELKAEINGLQGKCDALEQDKSNLERTLEQLREQYELAGCSLDGCSETIESIALENEELKVENERLTKELAIADRALGNCISEGKDNGNYEWLKSATVERIVELYKQQATKELEEQDK